MTNPKLTRTSNITGKTVSIRNAPEWDMIMLGEHLIRHQKDQLNLTLSETVVAAEEDCIIGFGILENDRDDTSCLMVKEKGRRHEIGAFIVRHLLEYAPMKTIYVASGKFGNFRKLDYSKKTAP